LAWRECVQCFEQFEIVVWQNKTWERTINLLDLQQIQSNCRIKQFAQT
jgi:hypothetical protein